MRTFTICLNLAVISIFAIMAGCATTKAASGGDEPIPADEPAPAETPAEAVPGEQPPDESVSLGEEAAAAGGTGDPAVPGPGAEPVEPGAATEPGTVVEPGAGVEPGTAVEPAADGAAGTGAISGGTLNPPLGTGPAWDAVRVARDQGSWDVAAQQLEGIIAASPSDSLAHYHLAVVQGKLGRSSEAMDHARRALEVDPGNLAAGRLAIALARSLGRMDEIQPTIDEVAGRQERNVDLQNLRVDALIARREYQRAIDLAQNLLKLDEVNSSVMKNLARAYYLMGRHKTANYIFKRAEEFSKNDWEILYYRALMMDKSDRARVDVVNAYRAVLALKPDFPEARNNLGLVLYGTRNYDLAAQEFTAAVKFAPGFIEAKLNLANALRGMKQYAEAEASYKELIEKHPEYAPPYFNLGLLYMENEFGGHDRELLLGKAADYLRQYKAAAGPREDMKVVDGYIREATDMASEQKKVREEESAKRAEEEAKYGNLRPAAEARIRELTALRERLQKIQETWASAGNAEKEGAVSELIAEFDSSVGSVLGELQTAIDNKSGGDMESYMADIQTSMDEFQPRIDEINADLPPGFAPGGEGGVPPIEPAPGGEIVPEPAPEPAPEPTMEPAPVEPAPEPAPVDVLYEEEPAPEPTGAPIEPESEGPPVEPEE